MQMFAACIILTLAFGSKLGETYLVRITNTLCSLTSCLHPAKLPIMSIVATNEKKDENKKRR